MADKEAGNGGRKLVVVESPAKAKTIAGYLGDGYMVESSIGHIRDLPNNASEVPAKFIMDNLFTRANVGLASAASTVLLLTVLALLVPWLFARQRAAARAAQ